MNENADNQIKENAARNTFEKVRIKLHFDLTAEWSSRGENSPSKETFSSRQRKPSEIIYKIPILSNLDENIYISEAELTRKVVNFLDHHLGEYLEEDLHVEHLLTMHGSLELILIVYTTASLAGGVLGSTSSLISSVNTIAEAIEDLSREWMWREDMVAISASATPVSRRRMASVTSSYTPLNSDGARKSVKRSSVLVIAVMAAVLSSIITGSIAYTLFSKDLTLIKADVQSLNQKLERLQVKADNRPN